MYVILFLVSALAGTSIWFLFQKIQKWYFKALLFFFILIAGWFLSMATGFQLDGKEGMLKLATNSPLWLLIGCTIGAWRSRKRIK